MPEPASMNASQRWAQLRNVDRRAIQAILRSYAPWRGIDSVSESLAYAVMNELQSELDDMPGSDHEYRRACIKCLRVLSKRYNTLPSQFYIAVSSLAIYDDVSYSGGAFSDIYRGTHDEFGAVCLKVLRTHTQGKLRAERVIKAFCEEALIWRQVRHESILPFLGVTELVPWRLCLISPWMENGNILTFLEKNPLHNRLGCVWDVAAGMQYLHSLDPCIIHKDIRGANILVGEDLHCYLADFGISLVLEETQMPGSSSRNRGNIRWLPPEMVLDSDFDPSLLREVDVYSFGCTIIEIYTGRPPYSDLRNDAAVIHRLALRKVPSQPPPHMLRPDLWNLVVIHCLSPSPRKRPSATAILEALLRLDLEYLDQYRAARYRGAAYADSPSLKQYVRSLSRSPSPLMSLSSTFVSFESVPINQFRMLEAAPTNDSSDTENERDVDLEEDSYLRMLRASSIANYPSSNTSWYYSDTFAERPGTPMLDREPSPFDTPPTQFIPTPEDYIGPHSFEHDLDGPIPCPSSSASGSSRNMDEEPIFYGVSQDVFPDYDEGSYVQPNFSRDTEYYYNATTY